MPGRGGQNLRTLSLGLIHRRKALWSRPRTTAIAAARVEFGQPSLNLAVPEFGVPEFGEFGNLLHPLRISSSIGECCQAQN